MADSLGAQMVAMRWSKLSHEERVKQTAPGRAAAALKMKKKPVSKREMSRRARSITPEAAQARAAKAWETRRANAEAKAETTKKPRKQGA